MRVIQVLMISALGLSFFIFLKSCDYDSVYFKTTRIGTLEVIKQDLDLEKMYWSSAEEACAELGHGWRLPTPDEWEILYKNRHKIGGFGNKEYWDSSDHGSYSFKNGEWDQGNSHWSYLLQKSYVRPVRNAKMEMHGKYTYINEDRTLRYTKTYMNGKLINCEGDCD